jgi:hypothetical protein
MFEYRFYEVSASRVEEEVDRMGAVCFDPTTARLSPGGQKTLDDETVESVHSVMSSGVEPVKVGERVARGIERNEFYVFTHPEWRSLVEGRYQEMLRAFGDAADPHHRHPIETIAAVQPGSPQRQHAARVRAGRALDGAPDG